MKFTLSWLRDHLDTTATLDEITAKLTAIGLEVERVEDRAATYTPFRVAYVEKAEKHPDADRLRVCIVNTGKEKLQVVCGAPNARTGMKAVFAPAGSVIPGTGDTLKKGVIRGQDSNGMLVSEREMGLSDEHNGIIEVPADAEIGTPFAALYGLDDPLIEINLTPNRADCAGVRGIARDLAAAGLGTLKPLNESSVTASFAAHLRVTRDLPGDACPHFITRVIRGVKNGPSPEWLQRRLKAVGLRPISALVDITNYVSLDLCRPLHVFDADKISGGLTVRLAKTGEQFTALDGKTYALDDTMTVIADNAGLQGLGGVMGGAASGCSDDTVNVILECACFDPLRTARTGRALGIHSDARYRFERGVDPAFTAPGAEIATRMILDLCGGEASEPVVSGAAPDTMRTIAYDPAYCEKLSGLAIGADRQHDLLTAVGCTVNNGQVTPPSWRADIEGRADLVEEVLRLHGYDQLPARSLTKPHTVTQPAETPASARARRVRIELASRGLDECVTWSFIPHGQAELFGANDQQAAASLRLRNPISADLDQMRPSLLPNLIAAAVRNHARGFSDVALFEVGPAFMAANLKGQAANVAGLRAGRTGPRHWSGPAASRVVDAFDVKADVLAALEACGLPGSGLQVAREAPGWFHPGRSGALRLGTTVVAHFGELHPQLLETFDTKAPVTGFEIFLDRLPPLKAKDGKRRKTLALSVLQPVERDFAFVVPDSVEADALIRVARGVDKALITRVDLFDVYRGAGIAPGEKSVALNIVIQPQDKTLTDAEIEALAGKIIAAVAAKTGGRLRTS